MFYPVITLVYFLSLASFVMGCVNQPLHVWFPVGAPWPVRHATHGSRSQGGSPSRVSGRRYWQATLSFMVGLVRRRSRSHFRGRNGCFISLFLSETWAELWWLVISLLAASHTACKKRSVFLFVQVKYFQKDLLWGLCNMGFTIHTRGWLCPRSSHGNVHRCPS